MSAVVLGGWVVVLAGEHFLTATVAGVIAAERTRPANCWLRVRRITRSRPVAPESQAPLSAAGAAQTGFIENQSTGASSSTRSGTKKSPKRKCASGLMFLERETGLEPATSTLARWHSTTELLP